ncbi:DUF2795 domain-containing protein [Saccharopolyspora cebuensis]|uniref:DUF2795 domain-containing protein n=1 Tax=Saccharopolyspora cebuensis TaxID=418759 RepID=A0ABV4CPF6_9PSEU
MLVQVDERAQRPVSRMEILDAIDNAFAPPPTTTHQIIAAAEDAHARSELIALLRRLPHRQFSDVRDLWEFLPDVPVDI